MSHGSSVNDIPLSCRELCNDQNSNDQNRHTECIHKGRTVNCDYYNYMKYIIYSFLKYTEQLQRSFLKYKSQLQTGEGNTLNLLLEAHSQIYSYYFKVPRGIKLIYYTDLNGKCNANSAYIRPKFYDRSQDFTVEIIEGGTTIHDMLIQKASHHNKELAITNGLASVDKFKLFKFLLYKKRLDGKLNHTPVNFKDDELFIDYQFNSTKLSDLFIKGYCQLSEICRLLHETNPEQEIILHLNLCRTVNAPIKDLNKYLEVIPMNIEQINQKLPIFLEKISEYGTKVTLPLNVSNIIEKIMKNQAFSDKEYRDLITMYYEILSLQK